MTTPPRVIALKKRHGVELRTLVKKGGGDGGGGDGVRYFVILRALCHLCVCARVCSINGQAVGAKLTG